MSTAPGISYVEIGSSDLDRSLDFYQGLLGLRPADAPPWPSTDGTRWLSAGPGLIKLVATGATDLGGWQGNDLQKGIRHVGLKVGDVDLHAERLRDAGVEFTLGPLDAVGGVRIAFFPDPDGANLEIIAGHLDYHRVWSPALAGRERVTSEQRPRTAGPAFDHVAVTADDLDATLAFYTGTLGFEVIGQVDHAADPRGFLITYVQAGGAVLEVFTYADPKLPNPWSPETPRLGLGHIGVGVGDPAAAAARLTAAGARGVTAGGDEAGLVTDLDGTPLKLVAPR